MKSLWEESQYLNIVYIKLTSMTSTINKFSTIINNKKKVNKQKTCATKQIYIIKEVANFSVIQNSSCNYLRNVLCITNVFASN